MAPGAGTEITHLPKLSSKSHAIGNRSRQAFAEAWGAALKPAFGDGAALKDRGSSPVALWPCWWERRGHGLAFPVQVAVRR